MANNLTENYILKYIEENQYPNSKQELLNNLYKSHRKGSIRNPKKIN